MIFKIIDARPIKEMLIRFTIGLYEYQGVKETQHSVYEVAVDVQPYVTAEDTADGVKLTLDGDNLRQELTNTIGALQLTSMVAKNMIDVVWNVFNEEEANEQPANTGTTERLSD